MSSQLKCKFEWVWWHVHKNFKDKPKLERDSFSGINFGATCPSSGLATGTTLNRFEPIGTVPLNIQETLTKSIKICKFSDSIFVIGKSWNYNSQPHVGRADSVEPGSLPGHVDCLLNLRVLHLQGQENTDIKNTLHNEQIKKSVRFILKHFPAETRYVQVETEVPDQVAASQSENGIMT